MSYQHLFQPYDLAGLRLPNRVVLPPLVVRKGAADGAVTEAVLEHYASCAGPGLVIVEATAVSPEGRLAPNQLGIFDDAHVEGLARLARLVHEAGASVSIQIHHAGRSTHRGNTHDLELVAPSPVAARPDASERETPRELDEAGIERILECFVAGGRRALRAGFDAVEVHAAHGYLVSQFLSPLANHRTDRWGGALENRARFLREAIRRIRAAVPDLRVSCRLGVADGEAGGLTLAEGLEVARMLEGDGVPFLDVSTGIGDAPRLSPADGPWSDRLLLSAEVKKVVSIPVIGVGGLVTPELAEGALRDGLVDLAAVGRALLADPAWARKALAGRAQDIHRCQVCKVCHHFRHGERCPARREAASVS